MDAPVYRPSQGFVQPLRVPRDLSTRHTAIADMRDNSEAWAIILKKIPGIERMLGNPMLQPHLGNFSFRSLIQFGIVQPETLDRLDVELQALGAKA